MPLTEDGKLYRKHDVCIIRGKDGNYAKLKRCTLCRECGDDVSKR